MSRRGKTGEAGEQAAASFLEEKGVRILRQNFRCRYGEIDLIGKDGEYLIIVEVKRRVGKQSGLPAEAVDKRKQNKICRTFDYYRMREGITDFVPVRFDVVEVNGKLECRWIKNAFEFQE